MERHNWSNSLSKKKATDTTAIFFSSSYRLTRKHILIIHLPILNKSDTYLLYHKARRHSEQSILEVVSNNVQISHFLASARAALSAKFYPNILNLYIWSLYIECSLSMNWTIKSRIFTCSNQLLNCYTPPRSNNCLN